MRRSAARLGRRRVGLGGVRRRGTGRVREERANLFEDFRPDPPDPKEALGGGEGAVRGPVGHDARGEGGPDAGEANPFGGRGAIDVEGAGTQRLCLGRSAAGGADRSPFGSSSQARVRRISGATRTGGAARPAAVSRGRSFLAREVPLDQRLDQLLESNLVIPPPRANARARDQ